MLIIDMPMPKESCYECPCADHENGRCQADKDERYYDFNIPKWCPIKGVLPDEHGDLIDRDALKSDIIKSLGINDRRYLLPAENAIWKVIDRRQAVIAAERKDDADYQLSVLMQEYFERYEPTYNSEDGSM